MTRFAIVFVFVLAVTCCLAAGESGPEPIGFTWYRASPGEMPVAICRIPKSRFAAIGNAVDLIAESTLHLIDGEAKETRRLPVLYPVTLGRDPRQPDDLCFLFRLPVSIDAPKTACVTVVGPRSYLPGKSRMLSFNQRHAGDWQVGVTVLDDGAGQALLADWQRGYAAQLAQRITEREDHELELLLDWRFFGFRRSTLSSTWKRDAILKFLFAISGLGDIEDAMPRNREALLDDGARTLAPPEGITLPAVEAKPVTGFTASPLAEWVPRDCWYLEWTSYTACTGSLDWLAEHFDQWSGKAYGRSAAGIITANRERLGLTGDFAAALEKAATGVVLAGRDPYFQSGTNLLVVVGTDAPLTPPAGVIAFQEVGGPLLLATSQALIDEACRCHEDGSNLRATEQFRDARQRLLAPKGEIERGFLYLSDPFITTFLSPRWYITGQRLLQVDARIRLVELLKLVATAELGRDVALADLSGCGLLPERELAWLVADLEERDGGVAHRTLGGIGAHPPIDDIPFDRVSAAEKEAYEAFSQRYQQMWRRMDPVGFTICDRGDGRWTTRLSVSPISRFSWFRQIMPYINQDKQPQRLLSVPGLTMGMCLRLDLKQLALDRDLPPDKNVSVQLLFEDFASSSHLPAAWLQESLAQDDISWARAPVAVVAPRNWTSLLMGLFLRGKRTPLEQDIFSLDWGGMAAQAIPLLVLDQPERPDLALAVNPGILRRLRDADLAEAFDPVASDLHLWVDLKAGYTLRRKLWFLAVVNRTLAGWRRADRLRRVAEAVGRDADDRTILGLGERGIFPVDAPSLALALDQLPRRPDSLVPDRGTRSVLQDLSAFPAIFLDLVRVDLYATVEANAIFIEGHFLREVDEVEEAEPLPKD